MQRCRNCKSEQFDGTIFCSECGASLISTTQKETTASLGPNSSDTGIRAVVENDLPTTINAPAPHAQIINLIVMDSGRRIQLEAGADLLVGRKDHAKGNYPDIDLGLEGGYDAGVSRRHAVIAVSRIGYTLQDLGSANGTFVNGKRLAPQAPVNIRHGDELTFGTLKLRFEIG